MTQSAILGLLAETSIHPGAGRSAGVVDLPVAREAATDFPVLVGSSLKGALRDRARQQNDEHTDKTFGKPDQAGTLLVSDARLLLLPVRSLTSSYRWVTCPLVLERLKRDLKRAGQAADFAVSALENGHALTQGEGHLFLEERQFSIGNAPDAKIIEAIKGLIAHEDTKARLEAQLAIVSNDDFAWFARYGLSVQARNVLNDETKQSENLWYEETLPADSVMWALLLERQKDAIAHAQALFPNDNAYLQAGGNETVGQGWFAVSFAASPAAAKGGAQ